MKRAICAALFAALLLCACTPIDKGDGSSGTSSGVSSQGESGVGAAVDKTDKIITVPSEDDPNWALFLVNNYNQLPDDYVPQLSPVTKEQSFHHKAADDFKAMLADAQAAGFNLYVVCTYRTIEYQKNLLENDIQKRIKEGLSSEEARQAAEFNIQKPGKSEHNTGLATDIVASWSWYEQNDYELTESFDQTPEFAWLSQNAYKYGFILRYPKDKEAITEITYEPWHYRYVGKEQAKLIKDSGLCLEEYMQTQK